MGDFFQHMSTQHSYTETETNVLRNSLPYKEMDLITYAFLYIQNVFPTLAYKPNESPDENLKFVPEVTADYLVVILKLPGVTKSMWVSQSVDQHLLEIVVVKMETRGVRILWDRFVDGELQVCVAVRTSADMTVMDIKGRSYLNIGQVDWLTSALQEYGIQTKVTAIEIFEACE